MDSSIGLNGVLIAIRNVYKGSTFRAISVLYQCLMECRANSTVYCTLKVGWETELRIEISEEMWNNMCRTQHTTTNSRIWKEFC